jgi:hypothetical protein
MEKYGKPLIKEIESLKEEIKRINLEKIKWTNRKTKLETELYNMMLRQNVDSYGGYKRDKLKPKPKTPPKRKKKKEKYNDAIQLFIETGIPDPERFYEELQKTQKVKK